MSIKRRIKDLAAGSFILATKITKKIVQDKDFYNHIIVLEGDYNSINTQKSKDSEDPGSIKRGFNRLLDNFVQLIDGLPNDFDLLLNRIEDLIKDKSITLLFDILCSVLKDKSYVIKLSRDFGMYQEIYFSGDSLVPTEDTLNNYDDIILDISEKIGKFITTIDENSLAYNWQNKYWEFLIKENNELEYLVIQSSSSGSSRFYADIIKRKDNARGKLLLWQEEYLTGEYKLARQYCDDLRMKDGFSDSQLYEYLSLTYSKDITPKALIKNYLSTTNPANFEKLLMYIERTQYIEGEKTYTLNDSLTEIYVDLMNSIKMYYQNVSFDYIFDSNKRGTSTKRNFIKKCIEATLKVHEFFQEKIESLKSHPLILDMILEIEGGGKYDWLNLQKEGLENKTTFDSIGKCNILKGISLELLEGIKISDYLYEKLKSKRERLINQKDENGINGKLKNACLVAYYIYYEDRFVELVGNKKIDLARSSFPEKHEEKFRDVEKEDKEGEFTGSIIEAEFNRKLKEFERLGQDAQRDKNETPVESLDGVRDIVVKMETIEKAEEKFLQLGFVAGLKNDLKIEPREKIWLLLAVSFLTLAILGNGVLVFGLDFLVTGIMIFIAEYILLYQIFKYVNFKNKTTNK